MQTPAGYEVIDGRFFPVDLAGSRLQSILPLSPRPHTVVGFYVTTGFVVLGVAA